LSQKDIYIFDAGFLSTAASLLAPPAAFGTAHKILDAPMMGGDKTEHFDQRPRALSVAK
jgi:hypothetical protein